MFVIPFLPAGLGLAFILYANSINTHWDPRGKSRRFWLKLTGIVLILAALPLALWGPV